MTPDVHGATRTYAVEAGHPSVTLLTLALA